MLLLGNIRRHTAHNATQVCAAFITHPVNQSTHGQDSQPVQPTIFSLRFGASWRSQGDGRVRRHTFQNQGMHWLVGIVCLVCWLGPVLLLVHLWMCNLRRKGPLETANNNTPIGTLVNFTKVVLEPLDFESLFDLWLKVARTAK